MICDRCGKSVEGVAHVSSGGVWETLCYPCFVADPDVLLCDLDDEDESDGGE